MRRATATPDRHGDLEPDAMPLRFAYPPPPLDLTR